MNIAELRRVVGHPDERKNGCNLMIF